MYDALQVFVYVSDPSSHEIASSCVFPNPSIRPVMEKKQLPWPPTHTRRDVRAPIPFYFAASKFLNRKRVPDATSKNQNRRRRKGPLSEHLNARYPPKLPQKEDKKGKNQFASAEEMPRRERLRNRDAAVFSYSVLSRCAVRSSPTRIGPKGCMFSTRCSTQIAFFVASERIW